MIGALVVRSAAVVAGYYLAYVDPTFVGEGTPFLVFAICLLLLADVFGIDLGGHQVQGPVG